MAQIKVNDQYIDVDLREELEAYSWTRPRWTSDKLIAASPFRYDRTPSFFVTLDGEYAGAWSDSGAYDSDFESGNFVKLLAFLRDETYEEAAEYLIELYGVPEGVQDTRLRVPTPTLRAAKKRISLPEGELTPYRYRHRYLEGRGITEKVQRFMGVGYCRDSRAVTLPWRHADGALANIKFRKVHGKAFWYRKSAAPIRTLVYGIDRIYKHRLTEVIVCEAEIDALSWWAAGRPAIAVGGTAVTKTQLDLIRKSPIERLVIAPDNDKAGGKLERKLAEGLRGYVALKNVKIPAEYKDANEALVAGVDLAGLPVMGVEVSSLTRLQVPAQLRRHPR